MDYVHQKARGKSAPLRRPILSLLAGSQTLDKPFRRKNDTQVVNSVEDLFLLYVLITI